MGTTAKILVDLINLLKMKNDKIIFNNNSTNFTFLVISRINNITLFSRMPKLFSFVFVSLTLVSLLHKVLNNIESKGTYVPAKYDGEDLIPGKVDIENRK